MHAVADAHETLASAPLLALGGRWRDQWFPFQRSTSVPPTAVHAVDELHEMLSRLPPLTIGLRRTDQRLPFQRSTMGR
jgi:hypothetical protein